MYIVALLGVITSATNVHTPSGTVSPDDQLQLEEESFQ
jgi:hypothetical protein